MKLLIKLAVVAFVANAAYQSGSVYLAHFQFTDAVRQAATVRDQTDEQLRQRILELADRHSIPMTGEDFSVERQNRRVLIRGAYVRNLTLAPRWVYPWRLTWDIDTQVVDPPTFSQSNSR